MEVVKIEVGKPLRRSVATLNVPGGGNSNILYFHLVP